MIFINSQGYEYQIRLVGVDEVDEITYENVRIDHPDRPDMTLEEYFAFAGAETERPYFEYKELEILESLIEGCGLRITQEDLDSLPKEYAKDILGHFAYARRCGRVSPEMMAFVEEAMAPYATACDDLESIPNEYVNIRIYRRDRDALAANMKYGETMADKIHALIEQARDESDSSDAPPCK